MLPAADGASQPNSGRKRTGQGALTYLTNDMLSPKTEKVGKILAVKTDEENRFGPRIILKLAFEGKTVFYGVNIKKNPNYKRLVDQFGREEDDWVGKEISLKLEQDEFTDGYFARVAFPEASSKRRGQ